MSVQQANEAELPTGPSRNHRSHPHRIFFYIYSQAEQRQPFEETLRIHLRLLSSEDYPDEVVEINFLRVRNEAEEDEAIRIISQTGECVVCQEIDLIVVDLR